MNVYRVKEIHCFGEAIIAASVEQEAIDMIDGEVRDLLKGYHQVAKYNVGLIKKLEYNSSSPRIISFGIDY